ncbi:hypothetical protein TK35_12580 [Lacticaseibacillus paracasei]|jgi:hypothetical protein|nr:hypothetical protein FAM18113_02154 [Lacticaseibacillus paracasei]TEA86585.1 hypothetical protein TK35_12580 [Lacticaseibacillus paracasei]TEA87922.1 hypothetical protein TK36_12655 [Lacticaseibacillus paracasei]
MKDEQDEFRHDAWFLITLLFLVVINIVAWIAVGISLIVNFSILFLGDLILTFMGIFLTVLSFIYAAILIAVLVGSWRRAQRFDT